METGHYHDIKRRILLIVMEIWFHDTVEDERKHLISSTEWRLVRMNTNGEER